MGFDVDGADCRLQGQCSTARGGQFLVFAPLGVGGSQVGWIDQDDEGRDGEEGGAEWFQELIKI